MSHAQGEVIRDGKRLGFFEYNGTCDFAIPVFYDTLEEVMANWRNQPKVACTCGKPPVDVILYADYGGGGYYWPAQACLDCHVLLGTLDTMSVMDETNDEYPKDGHPSGIDTEWARFCKGE